MLPQAHRLPNPNEPGVSGNQNRYGFRWENQKASEECERSSALPATPHTDSPSDGDAHVGEKPEMRAIYDRFS